MVTFLFLFFLKDNYIEKMAANREMADTYRNKEEGSFGVLNFRDLGVSSAENATNTK